jgi:DnaJ domain
MVRGSRKSVRTTEAPSANLRVCEHPGCAEAGEFRAPRSRENLNQYRWFCLEHVREYNSKWDFYRGMSEDEIEQHIRADQTWRRPTWKMSGQMRAKMAADPLELLLDPYDILADSGTRLRQRRAAAQQNNLSVAEQQALSILDLTWPQTKQGVKTRYKELAKRYHPDANGGDREAEERIKQINQAYSTLKQSPHFVE